MSRVGWNALLSLVLFAVSLLSIGHVSIASAADDAGQAAADDSARPKQLGQQVAEFMLRDFRGQEHKLSDWSDSKLVVLAFLVPLIVLVAIFWFAFRWIRRRRAAAGAVA